MSTCAQLVHAEAMPMQTETLGMPVREDVLFTDAKGRPHSGIRRSSEKILKNLEEPLRHALRKNEVVFYAATMTSPLSSLEQLTMSWWLYSSYGVVLIFTSERILVFPVERSGNWRGSIGSLEFGDIEKANTGGWISRGFTIRTRDGKKETYQRLKMRDAAKIKVLLPILMEGKTATPGTGWQAMCPRCTGYLTRGQYSCAGCNLQFRSEQKLLWRTLLPGGGYFYAGLIGVGIMAAVVEMFFLLELFGAMLLLKAPKSGHDRTDGWTVLMMFGLLLLLEKSVMYMHARRFIRWFLPEGKLQPKVG
jgi:hypothetical protein